MLPKAINRYQRAILQTRCQDAKAEIFGYNMHFWGTKLHRKQMHKKGPKADQKGAHRDFCLDVLLRHSAVVPLSAWSENSCRLLQVSKPTI